MGRGFILSHTRHLFFYCCFRSRTPGPPPQTLKDLNGCLTRYANYPFFSVALAVLPRTAFAATVGFKALVGSTECAAAPFVRRTPG
jgi:hypothetical protein